MVPIGWFSDIVSKVVEFRSLGAEFAERTHGKRHSETTKDKQEDENPSRGRVGTRVFIIGAIWMI